MTVLGGSLLQTEGCDGHLPLGSCTAHVPSALKSALYGRACWAGLVGERVLLAVPVTGDAGGRYRNPVQVPGDGSKRAVKQEVQGMILGRWTVGCRSVTEPGNLRLEVQEAALGRGSCP